MFNTCFTQCKKAYVGNQGALKTGKKSEKIGKIDQKRGTTAKKTGLEISLVLGKESAPQAH